MHLVRFLPLLVLLCASSCQHQWRAQSHRDQATSLVHEITVSYQQELHLLKEHANKTSLQKALKDIILLQHETYTQQSSFWDAMFDDMHDKDYPFIRFKKKIAAHINDLKKAYTRIAYDDTCLNNQLIRKLDDLNYIMSLIITLDEYQEEKRSWQQSLQQKELNALLHRQNKYLQEQNELLKKQQKKDTADASTGTIVAPPYPSYVPLNSPRG